MVRVPTGPPAPGDDRLRLHTCREERVSNTQLEKSLNFVSRSNSATEDKQKWVRDQRSIVLARASQMERLIDVVRTVAVCPGNSGKLVHLNFKNKADTIKIGVNL
ncbi:hypothetical protein TNCV_641041 [Trichonephila clavipes]|nr:hypothetical protein TNCV_641041 [Trichonephila clavipes]